MKKLKILIVEDEPIVALDIKKTIVLLGYDVIATVRNYDNAIKSMNSVIPDLVLMDINLKNSKDGIQTAYAMQNIHHVPIIYLTAYSDEATIARAVLTNPLNYIIKPFKREDIKTAITFGLHKINKKDITKIDENYEDLGEGYFYDFKNKNLYYDTLPLKLSTKEKIFLETLIKARGNIVSFSDLENISGQMNQYQVAQ